MVEQFWKWTPVFRARGLIGKRAAWLLNEQTMTRPARIDAALKAKIALEVVRESTEDC